MKIFQPEGRDIEELLINPEDASRLDENDVKKYLAACEIKTGANPHIVSFIYRRECSH